MGMLEGQVQFVIGVDTHRDSHTAAVCDPAGAVLTHATVATTTAGHRQLLRVAQRHAPGRRVWAVEGTGSFGAGLTSLLVDHGEWVVEVDRPKRPARRNGAKSDVLDATRAAREVLAREHLAQPRARGEREAMRVLLATRRCVVDARTKAINQLKALIVSAPPGLRERLRGQCTAAEVRCCARLRVHASHSLEHRVTVQAMRATARRILFLEAEAVDHQAELDRLVAKVAPFLLSELGVGALTAAQLLVSWSHPGRVRSEAAFAMLAGVAPLEASSGRVTRHRLNRAGDRQLNRALHVIALTRLRQDPTTQRYVARRRAEGKSDKEIRRCLKRTLARKLFRLMQNQPAPMTASAA
jgi:transposase